MNEEEFKKSVAAIDHRAEDRDVFESLQEIIARPFEYERVDETYAVSVGNEKHTIPLTGTRHDKYVIISSLAEIFKDECVFYLSDNSIEDDTHYIKVFENPESRQEIELFEYAFIPMKLGYDYFNGIDVPYLGHVDNNPDFEWEANQLNEGLHVIRPALVKEKLKELKLGKPQPKIESYLSDDPGLGKVGRDLRIKLGTASGKDKFIYYGSRYWWVALILGWLFWWKI